VPPCSLTSRQIVAKWKLLAILLVAGCSSWHRPPPLPRDLADADPSSRILVPEGQNVTLAATVVRPEHLTNPSPEIHRDRSGDPPSNLFTLPDALTFAMEHSPRLKSARAAIERSRAQEQVAFAPFLPEIDLLTQTGTTTHNLGPGAPGPTGFLLPASDSGHTYAQSELQLQLLLCDFGRTAGRYRQAAARERLAELQRVRAEQTVQFDVAVAYFNLLLARASHRVQEDAIARAEATLKDTQVRRRAGVADRDDVLRAEVQLSESREALVNAREAEYAAIARLNNAMGRNAGLPLQVLDLDAPSPEAQPALADYLEKAAVQRPEVGFTRETITAAQEGQIAARAELLPRIFVRGTVGYVEGENVLKGWQEGAGLHIQQALFGGGRRLGELHAAEADVAAAFADAQTILDRISLEVSLAFRGVHATAERIALSRTAVVQSQENLRLVGVKYRNGNATPTDIVDAETAMTRSQQRNYSASYEYLAALARLDYTLGCPQGGFLKKPSVSEAASARSPHPEVK
jgi:outer membrane protein TolC